jgi:hypothetical protein
MLLNTANLQAVLTQLVERPHWVKAAARIGGTEALMFQWLAKSRAAERAKDTASPFFLEWQDHFDYWHVHCAAARRQNLISLEALVRDQAMHGVETPMYSPDGSPIWQHDSAACAQWGNDVKAARDLGGLSDYPFAHTADGKRIQATRTDQVPATLRIKVLEQIPGYQQRSEVHVTGRTEQVVRVSGGAGSPALPPQNLDAKFTQLIDNARAAKAEAAKHLADPNRVTRPENGNLNPAYNGNSNAPIRAWPESDRRGRTTSGPQGFNVEHGNGRS